MTGPEIRAARKARGWTQAQLASSLGTTQATVSQWERGKLTPNPEQVQALTALLAEHPVADAQLSLAAEAPAPGYDAKPKKKARAKKQKADDPKGSLGFEAKLWEAADLLRSNMDPGEYKHVVLGLIFLKYISDAFDERQAELRRMVCEVVDSEYYQADASKRQGYLDTVLEDKDEYTGENVFWVPASARWSVLRDNAKKTQVRLPDGRVGTVGQLVDAAMDAIEEENPSLRHTLPREYAKPGLDQQSLGKLVDLISGIELVATNEEPDTEEGADDEEEEKKHRAKDHLGRVYEYFLSRFASAEGKGGGEFYTPSSVVRVLVEMLEPYSGRVYDPCCGSGGMFVQSMAFLAQHEGRKEQVSLYGQEYNRTTWRLARMNLAIRGIEANLGSKHADTFRDNLHPDLRADYILANPPFNIKKWHGETLRDDVRWKYGAPPVGNANFAWVQHIVHHLAPHGFAGFVLANGSMSSMQSGEGTIRQSLVEADLVDCMVALPGQLFYSTQIPVCLWFLARSKTAKGYRDRRDETLFIDARKLGRLETRVHKVLDAEEVAKIADTYHAWRTEGGSYEDVAGFCRSATKAEIEAHGFVLTPGRYVGAEALEEDAEPFEEKMGRLTVQFRAQAEESAAIVERIDAALRGIGW